MNIGPRGHKLLREVKRFLKKTPHPPQFRGIHSRHVDVEGLTYTIGKRLRAIEAPPALSVTYPRLKRDRLKEAVIAIHEYGHQGANILWGAKHGEADAWLIGKKLMPPHLVPRNYDKIATDRLPNWRGSWYRTGRPKARSVLFPKRSVLKA